ncbi:hypothetical protein QQX09_06155 [Demequina sp. SYSU T00192]|uniref:Coenzyme PQQ synthesis protein D (PqqD) n=1 Tax=Demequina litoralis TaxID=3051660 RepID=A0ABT8G914_9MICO|nr:hypothetical protein [Demequina sp. SYSU T00192]MDN4475434.1 hypothetical protein [Demequina sp. SYSU T00192]
MSDAYRLRDDAVVRSSWDDALERGGEMLVLAGNDVTLLSPLAAEAVLAARHGITVVALAERLVCAFGEPEGGDAGDMAREVVLALVPRGVMTLESAE